MGAIPTKLEISNIDKTENFKENKCSIGYMVLNGRYIKKHENSGEEVCPACLDIKLNFSDEELSFFDKQLVTASKSFQIINSGS